VPVACAATAANVNDTVLFERLLLAAFAVMARICTVFADNGYDAGVNCELCRVARHRARPARARPPARLGPGPTALAGRAQPPWVLENKRLALRYDRLGFVVQSLRQAACTFLVAGCGAREL
jgi:hypothetical protein